MTDDLFATATWGDIRQLLQAIDDTFSDEETRENLRRVLLRYWFTARGLEP